MNAALGPDVDPHRRRIHDQHLRTRRQPPRNDDLLLISSGESLNRKVGIRDLDPKSLDPGANDLTPFEATDKAKPVQETIHGSQNEVRLDRLTNDQSSPESGRFIPNKASASSVLPEPSSPVRPRISPR